VEISAPGVDVWSTIPRYGGEDADAYWSKTGTSMAAPHVAGVAALVWSYFPNCTNFQIRTALISSASEQGESNCDEYYGHGIVS
jgi:serine protease